MARWRYRVGSAFLLLAAMGLAGTAQGQDSSQDNGIAETKSQLQSAQEKLAADKERHAALERQATTLAADIARYQEQSVLAAHDAQQYEADLTQLEDQLDALDSKGKALQAGLQAHQEREAALLAALQRIAIEPPAALAFSPGAPVDSLRSAMLIGALEPRLKAEAAALSQSIADLQDLRAATDAKRAEIVAKQSTLAAERDRLAVLTEKRQALETSVKGAAGSQERQVAVLVAKTGSLKTLLDRLQQEATARAAAEAERQRREAEAEADAARAAKPPPSSGGNGGGEVETISAGTQRHPTSGQHRSFVLGASVLVAPVTGRITQRFGATDGFVTSKGLTIATQPGATVVSPFDGDVLFAGPFKGYGQILIIDHGGGYASLLARVDHIDVVVGQWVVAGEPVGTMANGASPDLYMEFRHKDQPINPLPLLGTK
jgi:septal ring factor EnvC (AmiA/AmiB activator)